MIKRLLENLLENLKTRLRTPRAAFDDELMALDRAHLDRQRETDTLARDIADDAARSTIECDCPGEQLGTRLWYDTVNLDIGDPALAEYIDRTLKYLDLRGLVIRHPQQRHLVRFRR